MLRRSFLFTFFLLIAAIVAHGKGRDTATVDSLNTAAKEAYNVNYSRSLALLAAARELSVRNGYAKGILASTCLSSIMLTNSNQCQQALDALYRSPGTCIATDPATYYSALGTCWLGHGNYDSALRYYTKALEQLSPTSDRKRFADECLSLARVYVKTGVHERGLEYYEQAIKIFNDLKDKSGWASSEDVLGEIFYAQRLYERALPHLAHSYQLSLELNDHNGAAAALLDLANTYYMQIKDDSARRYYSLALDQFSGLGDSAGVAICYCDLSRIALEGGDPQTAIGYAQKALQTIQPGNYVNLEAGIYQQLGDIYGQLNQYPMAINNIQRGLAAARAGGNKVIVKDCYKSLSELYTAMHRPEQALQNLLAAYRLKDSIEPIAFTRQLAEMDARYKAEKKEVEIHELKQQGLISSLKMEQQNDRLKIQGYLLLLLLVVLIASAAVIYYRNAKRRLQEHIQREKVVKETEERERMRIAKDIHDELGSGLSKILFLSERPQVMGQERSPEAPALITDTARRLIDNMRDLVWAMNPENTTLDNLAARIREYSSDYLEEFPLQLEIDIPEDIPGKTISKEVTRNIFMIVKEVLQNIVKHAQAGRVQIHIQVTNAFCLEIQDNGRGYDTSTHPGGNGLKNIRSRAKTIGADLEIHSVPGKGSSIKMCLPLASMGTRSN